MKTRKLMFAAVLILLNVVLTQVAYSNIERTMPLISNDSMTVELTDVEKEARITVRNLHHNNVVLKIEDNWGNALLIEKIKELGRYSKLYNFSKLGDGEYTITVLFGDEAIYQKVNISNGTLSVMPKYRITEVMPFFLKKGDFLYVSYINSEERYVSVSILDSSNEVIFEKGMGNELDTQGKFDISQLKKGKYTVKLSTFTKTYYEVFEIL